MFDIPVYWPILLMYFLILFVLTMKKEMTKWYQLGCVACAAACLCALTLRRYVPWSRGKKVYQ